MTDVQFSVLFVVYGSAWGLAIPVMRDITQVRQTSRMLLGCPGGILPLAEI